MLEKIDARVAAVAGVIAGTVAGLALGVSLGSSFAYQAPEFELNQAPIENTSGIVRPTRSYPEVDEWHEGVSRNIADLLWMSGPDVGNFEEVRVSTLCERFNSSVADLAASPEPPDAELAESFNLWVSSLEDTSARCDLIPEDLGSAGFFALMQRPALEMAGFLRVLETRVDLHSPR